MTLEAEVILEDQHKFPTAYNEWEIWTSKRKVLVELVNLGANSIIGTQEFFSLVSKGKVKDSENMPVHRH